jgi:predicted nucleotidyltransferase component of viral defense system
MTNKTDQVLPTLHTDPELFKASVQFTANQTGFAANLIEKDYLCSVLLGHVAQFSGSTMIFKGGTCLAKVHFGFYRLSEDLDFMIPMSTAAARKERSDQANVFKQTVTALAQTQTFFRLEQGITGSNSSRQYIATVAYTSLLDGHADTIILEVGLREPLLMAPVPGNARMILRNAANPGKAQPDITLPCMSFKEAMAEKVRAALTRREVAIRDFYDIDHAVQRHGLDLAAPDFIDTVRAKIVVPGNNPPDISASRLAALQDQLSTRLKAVLRADDFKQFDLDRAIAVVRKTGEILVK